MRLNRMPASVSRSSRASAAFRSRNGRLPSSLHNGSYQTAPATARSITFERPSTGLSDPDAPDGLPGSLNLALCCYKSGADEAR
jgi:hypothetical protein